MDECRREFGAELSGEGHSECRAYDHDRGRESRERLDPGIRCSGSLTGSNQKTAFLVAMTRPLPDFSLAALAFDTQPLAFGIVRHTASFSKRGRWYRDAIAGPGIGPPGRSTDHA